MSESSEEATVTCSTSKGEFKMKFFRNWSPLGYDRAVELFERGFYDHSHFFRGRCEYPMTFRRWLLECRMERRNTSCRDLHVSTLRHVVEKQMIMFYSSSPCIVQKSCTSLLWTFLLIIHPSVLASDITCTLNLLVLIVLPGFLVQFGISYSVDRELKKFARQTIPDDPHRPDLRQVNNMSVCVCVS